MPAGRFPGGPSVEGRPVPVPVFDRSLRGVLSGGHYRGPAIRRSGGRSSSYLITIAPDDGDITHVSARPGTAMPVAPRTAMCGALAHGPGVRAIRVPCVPYVYGKGSGPLWWEPLP